MTKFLKKQKRLEKALRKPEEPKPHKSVRGRHNNRHGELKKNVTVSLTPTGRAGIDEICDTLGITRSEFLERVGRLPVTFFKPLLAEIAPLDSPSEEGS